MEGDYISREAALEDFESCNAENPNWTPQRVKTLLLRHARRPERSWFTLNISVTKDKPTRIQLHGYGNEWAHGERLTIPQRVLDFVDRWETEILLPAFRQVRAAELAAKPARRKRGAA
jgi:hypothetical protein